MFISWHKVSTDTRARRKVEIRADRMCLGSRIHQIIVEQRNDKNAIQTKVNMQKSARFSNIYISDVYDTNTAHIFRNNISCSLSLSVSELK